MEPTISDVTVKKDLQCALTEKEIMAYGHEMAKQYQDMNAVEKSKKEAMTDFGARISRIESEITELSRKISNGFEYRPVDCKWTYEWDEGVKTLIRQDTKELVKQEPIEPYERQGQLDLEEKLKADAEQAEEVILEFPGKGASEASEPTQETRSEQVPPPDLSGEPEPTKPKRSHKKKVPAAENTAPVLP